MQENKPILIVGLGNPGVEYERTRHNVGFIAVRRMAGDNVTWKSARHALIASDVADGVRVIFALPQTFMNNSGIAVREIMQFYKIPLENLVVIHDDMDLPIGTVRQKIGGGSAGHNGIKSIDANVGNEYRRVRIGIGHPRDLKLPINPADWVLGRFDDAQYKVVISAIDNIQI